MWNRGGDDLQMTNNVSSTTMNNSLVYTDSYNISSLSTDDENRTYLCEVVINSSPIVTNNASVTLDVTGKICSYMCNNKIIMCTVNYWVCNTLCGKIKEKYKGTYCCW